MLSASRSLLRAVPKSQFSRCFGTAAILRADKSAESKKVMTEAPEYKIPGYRGDGTIPTNYEVATGIERYEFLKELEGKDAFEEMKPIVIKGLGTRKNPVLIRGVDPAYYVNCSGYPADSHEAIWLTLTPGDHIHRCPECGNVFKYEQLEVEEPHHH